MKAIVPWTMNDLFEIGGEWGFGRAVIVGREGESGHAVDCSFTLDDLQKQTRFFKAFVKKARMTSENCTLH